MIQMRCVTVERAVAVVMGVRFDTTVTVFSDDSCMVVTAVTIVTVMTLKWL